MEEKYTLKKLEDIKVKRQYLQTLWVLNLNPNPPSFTLLDKWVRRHGTVEEALNKVKRDRTKDLAEKRRGRQSDP